MASIKAWIRGNGALRTRDAISGYRHDGQCPAGQVRRALGVEGRGVGGWLGVRDQRFVADDLVHDLRAGAHNRHAGADGQLGRLGSHATRADTARLNCGYAVRSIDATGPATGVTLPKATPLPPVPRIPVAPLSGPRSENASGSRLPGAGNAEELIGLLEEEDDD
jgi:hypothetical protein